LLQKFRASVRIRFKERGEEIADTIYANFFSLRKFRALNIGVSKIIATPPPLPDFPLALNPEDYELPHSDPLQKEANHG
jgi:hypothetical protein